MEHRPELRLRIGRRGALAPAILVAFAALAASCAREAPREAARPAAPSAPATPEPPSAPPGQAYIVFFEWGSSRIEPRGRQIIAEAVRAAGSERAGGRRFELQAYADRSGRSDRNQRLSRRRAEAVAAALARRGVRRGRITIEAHGEDRAFVPTEEDAREGRNRAVWIVLR